MFEKGSTKNWTREVFKVVSRHPTQPPVYRVSDLNGEHLEGAFYAHELQTVSYDPQQHLLVEAVLKEEGRGSRKRYWVKWLGYPSSFNSWVHAKDMKKV